MTWEWVVLILGTFAIVALLFGFVSWTIMKAKIAESIPRTIPDMLTPTKRPSKENSV